MNDIITTEYTETDANEALTTQQVEDLTDAGLLSTDEQTDEPTVVISAEDDPEPTDDSPILLKVREGLTKQRMGTEDQNVGLIMICEAIAEANATGDGNLKSAIADAMGKKRSDAELTWRGNFGKLLGLPTDITKDPVRVVPVDDETGEPLKEGGAAYYKGRLRKYCQQVAKADSTPSSKVTPSQVMDELLKESSTLQDALATIEAALASKHATVIENLFSAGSVTKALKMVRGDEELVGDLDAAIVNAEALKVLLDTFLSEAENA